ncbi:carbohydrate porin [Vibrio maerlii]|uniref:carbohydrate porin n=1 Tax=Vibrio maerlii TaxID=2231648 RepID=UPI000E3CDEEB|nr:carbohydrate porin [Vibrio maerlii]
MKNTFKLSLAAVLVSSAMAANAGISIVDSEEGNFSIGGNVELNFNYQDRDMKDDSEFNQDGRVLIEFAGQKFSDNGHYVGVKAQPLFESTGNVAMDDAYFEFGKVDGWGVKAGRFEAYDMFPVGLDVFLEYSGDTSNELYVDGTSYVYQMKEARGRGADGQIMYSQDFGGLYVEVGAMIGDRTNFFADGVGGTYHGQQINDDAKDSFALRPVVGYSVGDFSFAAAIETQLVKDALTVTQGGKTIDLMDRTGYGLTGTWAKEDITVNANLAYMDAVDETNMSAGLNAVYKGFGLGYIYGTSEYENKEISGYAEGDVDVNTVYASYEFADVLSVQDFSVLLGTYYTTVDNKTNDANAFDEHDDFGARVRLFYEF